MDALLPATASASAVEVSGRSTWHSMGKGRPYLERISPASYAKTFRKLCVSEARICCYYCAQHNYAIISGPMSILRLIYRTIFEQYSMPSKRRTAKYNWKS